MGDWDAPFVWLCEGCIDDLEAYPLMLPPEEGICEFCKEDGALPLIVLVYVVPGGFIE